MSAVQAVADDSGATALVAVLVERTAPLGPELWIANAGDCRALIRRAGHAVQLTNDHCGANAAEAERLCLDGVSLARTADGKLRVHGLIEVTRSIGDRCHSSRIAMCARAAAHNRTGWMQERRAPHLQALQEWELERADGRARDSRGAPLPICRRASALHRCGRCAGVCGCRTDGCTPLVCAR